MSRRKVRAAGEEKTHDGCGMCWGNNLAEAVLRVRRIYWFSLNAWVAGSLSVAWWWWLEMGGRQVPLGMSDSLEKQNVRLRLVHLIVLPAQTLV